ncbi:hypothetical protein GCM10025734_69170 [Kitasatospora paranensis]
MTRLPAATAHRATGSSHSTYGSPNVCSPATPAATRVITSRSARSTSPETSTGKPRLSPRALVYDTTWPLARQNTETAQSRSLFPLPAYQSARPPKMAASATRSSVESRNAPHLEERPAWRAMLPSTRSEKMNRVIVMVPQKNSPRGKNTRAPATDPAVPISVTASGLTPQRSSIAANGVRTRVKKARAYLLSMAFRTAPISPDSARGACAGGRPSGSTRPAGQWYPR